MNIKLFHSANTKMISIALLALILNCVKLQAHSKPWTTPVEFISLKNPVIVDPASIKNGKTLYTSYCTPCHGDKGKGDGAAAFTHRQTTLGSCELCTHIMQNFSEIKFIYGYTWPLSTKIKNDL
jgi:hypothetical protein